MSQEGFCGKNSSFQVSVKDRKGRGGSFDGIGNFLFESLLFFERAGSIADSDKAEIVLLFFLLC